jgi:hypothetical protein
VLLSKASQDGLKGSIVPPLDASLGSVPLAISSPSLTPSPSESGLFGSVPWIVSSSSSINPSPSVSVVPSNGAIVVVVVVAVGLGC